MPCYFPRPYAVRGINPLNGKKVIKVLGGVASPLDEHQMACRQCIGCRLERSRQWAIRCVHEMKQHEKNCWLTLTYAPEHLPPGGTLVKRDVQLFMKRLRKRYGQGIRYYYCGEYGEKRGRPHYHIMLFGHDFEDREPWKQTHDGFALDTSEELSELWEDGIACVSDATFETAAYTARYITKKVLGKKASVHYEGLTPEFTDMSRRPGIGKTWWDKHKGDLIANDEVSLRGKEFKPPEYYDKQLEKNAPTDYAWLKTRRNNQKIKNLNDLHKKITTPNKLAQTKKERANAAKCKTLELAQKKRKYENGT